jgi:hypothetical protein
MCIVDILYVVLLLAILISYATHLTFMLAYLLPHCYSVYLLAWRPIIVHILYSCIKGLMMMNI